MGLCTIHLAALFKLSTFLTIQNFLVHGNMAITLFWMLLRLGVSPLHRAVIHHTQALDLFYQ